MLHKMQSAYKHLQQSNEWVATMTEHTKTDGLPGMDAPDLPQVLERARPRNERMNAAKVECNACPVLCQISEGRAGACDRYANQAGVLVRLCPLVLLRKTPGTREATLVSFAGRAPAAYGAAGEVVGHVTTAEYGSQMLSLGGVHHLTGGTKKEGRITAEMMQALGNKQAVEFTIDGGSQLVIQAGRAPIVNVVAEQRMRVGCGSAAIGIFARQFFGHADEVVVVDDHITGVLTEHQAGRCLDMKPSGIQMRGRKSTPGRYFQVANPGTGWGGTDIADPLSIIEGWDESVAWPGLRLLMTSTTGEHASWYVLDEQLNPVEAEMPVEVRRIVDRIGENCEPSLASVLFLGGAGGSLRAGVTENPVLLTRSIKNALVNVTCGGAPAYVWPGGGITVMADVLRMPDNSFGTVPTPAIVAPIEFSMRRADYEALAAHPC